MKKFLAIACSALALVSCGPPTDSANDTDAVEAGSTADPAFELSFEKFTLDNGLDVILHVDRSDPIVAFTTVVHAGSNREKPGRTGFAHFFEHMAFNDSENVPRGWNRKAIPDWGGQRNGGTWSDGTIYYEVVPKDAFDKILWIDSDRLGYMLNTVTQAALDREKQVVKNEKRQRVDNAAYGYSQEVIRSALYPEGHPYSWTVIGALPDLQAATLEDLTEFYDQYYGAGNATLAIVGDIDIAETREKVERWFGEIRKGPNVEPLPAMPVTLTATKSLSFEDNFAKLPELRLTFPSVEAYHKDEQALRVLAQILAGSKTSPLYRFVVEKEKLAPNVSAYNNSMELAGEFVFRVRANAGTDLDAVNAALSAALADFAETGVNETDLERIKAEQETILYSNLSTVLGKSNQLARDSEFAGDPAYSVVSAELLRAVTAEQVMAAFRTYVDGQPSVMTSFYPKGMPELAVEGSEPASVWIETVSAGAANEEVSQGEEASYEKTPSKYDRSEPPFGELPLIKMPAIWQASLDNNVPVYGIETTEIPLVSFDVILDGGVWLDPDGKAGTAHLLANLMNEGTATRTAAEFEQAVGLLGSGISVSARGDEIRIRATSLARNFEPTVDLIAELLSAPRFEQSDFERVKSAALTSIKGREANSSTIAALNFNRLIYGPDHPMGRPGNGTLASVESITLQDVSAFYQVMLGAGTRIHIAGDVDEPRAKTALNDLAAAVREKDSGPQEFEIPAQSSAGKVFFIDVPGSKQSVINVGQLTLSSTDPDSNKLTFTNEKLGGGISGDLAQVLRIEKGYTYGAYSSVSQGRVAQPFRVATSVRANATGASLDVIRQMLRDYGRDFSDADVETTRQKLVKENTRAFESLNAKLGTLQSISKYGKSLTYVEDAQQELLEMPLEEYKRVAADYLSDEGNIYLIVGDRETQLEAVKAFAGGEVIELDIYGDVLN
jgi:zinc protease